MDRSSVTRRLIVNADDFGRSSSINRAIAQAHREGILTSASLMVNEPACAEAVELARANPNLGVGLHLTLLCGRTALDRDRIPGLTIHQQQFGENPLRTGLRYFFMPGLRGQLRSEIHEQFRRFRSTGLRLDHVNGHLHIHMHPTVLSILARDAVELGITRMRVVRDPLITSLRLSSGALGYRISHWTIFSLLGAWARRKLFRHGIHFTRHVFGMLQNGRVDEDYLLNLANHLPPGESEIYSHPCLTSSRHEFEALVSPRVRKHMESTGIKLVRYSDL